MTSIREILRYRVLIWALVTRDLRARYRGSVLGFLWTFLNPILLTLVYGVVFSFVTRVQMQNYTYFLLVGLLPWIWFSTGFLAATTSISDRRDLLTKVRIAPEVMPFVVVLSNGVNFLLSLPILVAAALISGVDLSLAVLALPAIFIVQLCFTYALSLLTATFNVFFRDLQHILGNIMTLWFFLTPIIYRYQDMPADVRIVADVNPVSVLARAYQAIFFENRLPDFYSLLVLFGVALALFAVSSFAIGRFRESLPERI